jgi:2-hydroxychromene-2-carboxylate isomerase
MLRLGKVTPCRKFTYVPSAIQAGLMAMGGGAGEDRAFRRSFVLKDCARKARLSGMLFRPPVTHPFNPLCALRVSLAEVAGSAQLGMVRALETGWGTGQHLGSPESVARILTDAGYDGDDIVARARDAAIKAALKRSSADAIERGVFGVPTLSVGEQLFWGFEQLESAERYARGEDLVDAAAIA